MVLQLNYTMTAAAIACIGLLYCSSSTSWGTFAVWQNLPCPLPGAGWKNLPIAWFILQQAGTSPAASCLLGLPPAACASASPQPVPVPARQLPLPEPHPAANYGGKWRRTRHTLKPKAPIEAWICVTKPEELVDSDLLLIVNVKTLTQSLFYTILVCWSAGIRANTPDWDPSMPGAEPFEDTDALSACKTWREGKAEVFSSCSISAAVQSIDPAAMLASCSMNWISCYSTNNTRLSLVTAVIISYTQSCYVSPNRNQAPEVASAGYTGRDWLKHKADAISTVSRKQFEVDLLDSKHKLQNLSEEDSWQRLMNYW